ncbi:MAG TPA: phosphatase PAP2 family protein [Burkholderiaceae bacterium]|nr:phosphatase PAP2 family protein [Burkholderiaceae bacterium]
MQNSNQASYNAPLARLADDATAVTEVARTDSDLAAPAEPMRPMPPNIDAQGHADGAHPSDGWRPLLARADAMEMRIVRRLAGMARFRAIRAVAIAVNFLGNGWVYVPIALALLLFHAPHAKAVLGAATLASAVAHALYAVLKRKVARPRPFERDPALPFLVRALDRYSFPSGHCMTLTAVLVPIVHSAPESWPVALAALSILAWGRLTAAHHYPSDVVAGMGLGAVVAIPLASWLLPV